MDPPVLLQSVWIKPPVEVLVLAALVAVLLYVAGPPVARALSKVPWRIVLAALAVVAVLAFVGTLVLSFVVI